MKFTLLKDEAISFQQLEEPEPEIVLCDWQHINVNLVNPHEKLEQKDSALLSVLQEHFNNRSNNDTKLEICISMPNAQSKIAKLELSEETGFFKNVCALRGLENISVKVKITNFDVTKPLTISKEMPILDASSMKLCKDNAFNLKPLLRPEEGGMSLTSRKKMRGLLDQLFVTVEVTIFSSDSGDQDKDKNILYKKMLQNTTYCDLELTSNTTKNPIKCHKSVLAASSPVFNESLEANMMRFESSQLLIKHMTEEGLRALVAYIYHLDEEIPNKQPDIAFELLKAGYRYSITPDLGGAMKKLLLAKPAEWFYLEVAIKLFAFAKSFVSEEELVMKATQVLKSYSSGGIAGTDAYKEMLKNDRITAMELQQLVFEAELFLN